MNSPRCLLYGATGYTGKLIAQLARERDVPLLLSGRDTSRLSSLSRSLGFEYKAATLNQADTLDKLLRNVDLVINAAGPFALTSRPLVDACLRCGSHYIDVTGEIPVFDALQQRHAEARDAAIMLMPGVGFAVLASDCLAAHLSARLPDANRLRIGISRSTLFSRGSAKTMIELFDQGVKVRQQGALISIPIGSLEHTFDFGAGGSAAIAVSWPDVFTAFHTTRIPNIETYFESGPAERAMALQGRYSGWLMNLPLTRPWLNMQVSMLPEGPSQQQRASSTRVIVAEVENSAGQLLRSRVTTPEAYSFTALSTMKVAADILAGKVKHGFQTPAGVYGAEVLSALPGVTLEDNSG